LFEGFGEVISDQYFISGPKYTFHDRRKICLLNFLLGMTKIAIWKTRKNKLLGIGTVDAENAFKGMVTSRIKIEYTYFQLINDIQRFAEIWSVEGVLCEVLDDMLVFQILKMIEV